MRLKHALLLPFILGAVTLQTPVYAACTVRKDVPWSWNLEAGGKPNAAISVSASQATDPSLTKFPASDTLSGFYTAKLLHTPPSGYCGIDGSLPDSVLTLFVGRFTGAIGNVSVYIPFVAPGPFAEVKANVDILPAFGTASLTLTGVTAIDEQQSTIKSLAKDTPFGLIGSLNGFVSSGLVVSKPDPLWAFANANLSVSASIDESLKKGKISYLYEAPGPLPILGIGAAFGYTRKLRKRIKASKPEVISTTAV
jgi:hypothetical protein